MWYYFFNLDFVNLAPLENGRLMGIEKPVRETEVEPTGPIPPLTPVPERQPAVEPEKVPA